MFRFFDLPNLWRKTPILLIFLIFSALVLSVASAKEQPWECVDCHTIGVLSMSYSQPTLATMIKPEVVADDYIMKQALASGEIKSPESAHAIAVQALMAGWSEQPNALLISNDKTYIAMTTRAGEEKDEGFVFGLNPMLC